MVVGLTIILVILIVCASILFGLYMGLCSENEVGMFADPQYEKRIKKLEEHMEELKKE